MCVLYRHDRETMITLMCVAVQHVEYEDPVDRMLPYLMAHHQIDVVFKLFECADSTWKVDR